MISTALAATLVDEYGEGRSVARKPEDGALREMTRISASPYSMWRDVALTTRKTSARAAELDRAWRICGRNLDTRELALDRTGAPPQKNSPP